MSCKNSDDCFEIAVPKCDDGCKDIVSTDCIFHNTYEDAKLFNIGITKGSSLKYILLAIDKKLENTIITNFGGFNMHGLNLDTEILTLKQFVEAITLDNQKIKENNLALEAEIETIDLDLEDLASLVSSIINISVSSNKLNINSVDEIRVVINKILSYLEDFELPTPITFNDSETVEFSQSGSSVIADIKISEDAGNTIIKRDDGLYSAHLSVTSILNTIQGNAQLKEVFSSLVMDSFPPFKYDIMSTINTPIKYINDLNTEVTITAKANILLKLNDVKNIITSPSDNLTITFKGI